MVVGDGGSWCEGVAAAAGMRRRRWRLVGGDRNG